MILKQDIERILDEYLPQKETNNSTSTPIAQFIENDFQSDLKSHLAPHIHVETAAGNTYLALNPRVSFIDRTIDSPRIRLNVMYFFKQDMSGLYLTLKIPFYQELKNKHGGDYPNYLQNEATKFKRFLNNNNKLTDGLIYGLDLPSRTERQRLNDKATVVAKYYEKGNIPSTEELVDDINYFLELRKFLVDNFPTEKGISVDEWFSVLENGLILDNKMLNILEILYDLGDMKITVDQFIERTEGFDKENFRRTINSNSNRVNTFLNKKPSYKENRAENIQMTFFNGEKIEVIENGLKVNLLKFKLKDELIEAIDKFNKEEIEDIETEEVDIMEEEKNYYSFYKYLLEKGYYFDKETIENYLLSLKVKPFTILTGNSGTGKTKLSQLFAQYLMDNNQINQYLELDEEDEYDEYYELETIDDEEDSEEYITFKTRHSFLKNGFFSLGNKTLDVILGLYNHDYYMDFTIDGIEATLPLKINPSAKSYDRTLLEHLNSLKELSDAEIKISKKDLENAFSNQKPGVDKVLEFTRFRGEDIFWSMPYKEWENIINIKIESTLNAVVDGIKTTFTLTLYSIIFDAGASENTSLKRHVLKKGLREKLSFTADLSSLEIIENDNDSIDFEKEFGVSLINDNEPIENNSNNVVYEKIEENPEYIHAKVKASTILKNSEATIKKDYLNKYMPINDYLGHFDGFIDDVPSGIGLNIVSYIRFKRNFIKEHIEPNYTLDDMIDIKIKLSDIIDFLPKPDFKGFAEFKFNMGSMPKFRIRHMNKEDHMNFFNLDDRLRDCEVIIDGVSTVGRFYIYDTLVCLKSDETDAYFEELSQKDDKNTITIKLNLDTFENLIDSVEGDDEDEEFDDFDDGVVYSNIESNYKIIPVGANWTENRHIVGYYNVITNEYQSTPAYDLIKAANKSSEPHFLILDEMNLSHVERYFADFLSAIESKEKIPLYGEEELTLPDNLFIIGTVNVDETTYMFSPKVLDRANVIEFETYSASDYMKGAINLSPPGGNISYLEDPLAGSYIQSYGIDELRDFFDGLLVDGEPFWNILTSEIYSFQTILKESGFDFGFRVINEIVRFMAVAWEYEERASDFDWTRYFDACIKQKLLPKLHGSEKIIGETLDNLYRECVGEHLTYETAKYPDSARKLNEMREVLRKQRYVSFIN